MEYSELYARLERLVDDVRVGLFATVGDDEYPSCRWMTPVFIPGRSGFLYAVTAPGSAKAAQAASRPKASWLFQSKALDAVFTVKGIARLIDEPQAKAEVLEAIGPRLQIFWRVNPDAKNLVVLETELSEISCFFPMRGEQHRALRG